MLVQVLDTTQMSSSSRENSSTNSSNSSDAKSDPPRAIAGWASARMSLRSKRKSTVSLASEILMKRARGENRAEITQAELFNYRKMFRAFDKDGSGELDMDEIGTLLQSLGVPDVDMDMLSILKQRFDEDGNGMISFDEFLTLMLYQKELSSNLSQSHAKEVSQAHIRDSMRSSKLLPDDVWKWVWDIIIIFCIFYYTVMVPYKTVKGFEYSDHCHSTYVAGSSTCYSWLWLLVEILLTLFLCADVIINFHLVTTTGNNKEEPSYIAKRYIGSWFSVDFISSFPFDLIFSAAGWNTEARIFAFLRCLKLLKVPELLIMSKRTMITPSYVYFYYQVVPLCKYVFWALLGAHLSACFWILLKGSEYKYTDALYWTLYTLCGVGYGDVAVTTSSQKIFACFLFVVGVMSNGVIVGRLTVAMQHADIDTSRRDRMRETLAVLSCFDIPIHLQGEILSFQNHNLEHNLTEVFDSIISGLPTQIQDQLSLYGRVQYVSLVPMFAYAHHECKVALAQSLRNLIFSPEEFIIMVGENGDRMYFLSHGVADVIAQDGSWLATIKKGGFFGEVALLMENIRRTASIKALTFCDVFCLAKDDFFEILKQFPRFREDIEDEIQARSPAVFDTNATGSPRTDDSKEKDNIDIPSDAASSLGSRSTVSSIKRRESLARPGELPIDGAPMRSLSRMNSRASSRMGASGTYNISTTTNTPRSVKYRVKRILRTRRGTGASGISDVMDDSRDEEEADPVERLEQRVAKLEGTLNTGLSKIIQLLGRPNPQGLTEPEARRCRSSAASVEFVEPLPSGSQSNT